MIGDAPKSNPARWGGGPWIALLAIAVFACIGWSPTPAQAITQGTIGGVVTGAGGPVAGAHVVLIGENGNSRDALSGSDGGYSVTAWPDTYRIGVVPPQGSSDGFTTVSGVVLPDGGTATANIVLSSQQGSARVSGNASYADHSPNAGVEVLLFEHIFGSGVIKGNHALTDESGNWDAGALAAGAYDMTFVVNISNGGPGKRIRHTLASRTIFLEAGQDLNLSTTLSGPKPEGMLEATVIAAEGWPAEGSSMLLFPGEESEFANISPGEPERLYAPTGTYTFRVPSIGLLMDQERSQPVSVSNGHITRVTIQLDPLPTPAGTEPQGEQQLLGWLNAQRGRWGLPANLRSVPLWSRGCAAHDVYGALNNVLQHPETFGPGHSEGGQWAGEHSILAAGGAWGAGDNPWYDAPIHLNQLFTPELSLVGIDDSRGYQCVTTWPGIKRDALPPGTIHTFPGDGTTGLPPAEYASELPTTPNKVLGIDDLAGRQLFVYEAGTRSGVASIQVLSASLRSAGGSTPVKWMDQEGGLNGFLTGAIIVPTKPLQPFTTYTATVTLAAVDGLDGTKIPQKTHTWSFTTGHDNPGGGWGEKTPKKRKTKHNPRREVRTSYKAGRVIIRGRHFDRGRVTIKRKVRLKSKRRLNGRILATAHVGTKGTFVAKIRWPRKHLTFRVYQGGKSTFGIYEPPKKRKHRHPR